MNGDKLETVEINGVSVDTKKAQRLLQKTIIKEKNNIKTKQYNDVEMAKKIKKMIEEEVECF